MKGLLCDYIKKPVYSATFRIEKNKKGTHENCVLYLVQNNNLCLFSGSDSLSFYEAFYSEVYNKKYDSVLIAGLGLGVLPFIFQKDNCKIDVLEVNDELIKTITSFNYLQKVNIIKGNALNFTPIEKYDLIVLDIWSDDSYEGIHHEIHSCVQNYSKNLKPDAFIYVPINKIKGQTIWN